MRLPPPNLFPLLFCVTSVLAQGPDAASTTTTPTTTSALQISTDGSCGSGRTCSGSLYGQCCSEHWFCGSGDAYCGTGCHAEFGECEDGISTSPAPDPVTTVTVIRTITAFATGLFTTTTTVTGAVTRTVLATSVVSTTDVRTLTQTQTLTITTVPALSTSVIYSYSYITRNLTQIVLSTSTLTATGCFPTSAAPSTMTVTSLPLAPSPTLTGSPATCKRWYQVQKGETCATVASKNGVTVVEM
ncbi:hypothetical protein GE09DRAFT_1101073 [Coniochaeta sp. 2T2.1]|nr:hypothetical protein GE09DRAFT_1101073 [Coniochaeta sp. 2T2.1]